MEDRERLLYLEKQLKEVSAEMNFYMEREIRRQNILKAKFSFSPTGEYSSTYTSYRIRCPIDIILTAAEAWELRTSPGLQENLANDITARIIYTIFNMSAEEKMVTGHQIKNRDQ